MLTPGTSTRHTVSAYFSPNSAMAPRATASFCETNSRPTGMSSRMARLTICSTLAISSAVMAEMWVKSKRRRSGPTREPDCFTWSPSTWRRAEWSRWVVVWLRELAMRLRGFTERVAVWPERISPSLTKILCTVSSAAGFRLSSTSAPPVGVSTSPLSPSCPPDSP